MFLMVNVELLKSILVLTQEELHDFLVDFLLEYYEENNMVEHRGNFIYVKGEIPVLMVAHLDTVHTHPPVYDDIFYDQDNTGYYTNPASDSNLNTGTFNGRMKYSNYIVSNNEGGMMGSYNITSTAASTSTSTGALIVDGGAGIAGNLFASTITLTGGAGGAQLNLRSGGDLVCFNSDNSGSISVYCDNNNQLIVNGSLRATATVGFTSEYDNGNSGSSYTINFNNGQKQRITLTAAPCTLSFTAPTVGVGNFLIKIVQDGGGSKTITWPATVKWPNGTAPTLSTAAGAIDIVSLYYDGTNYYSVASLNFS
jgi:hypothetical protein